MKKLYLVRHAKAELPLWDKKDYDRNLIPKGIDRALHVAKSLKQMIDVNEKNLIISSSANRAIQTAHIFCKKLNYPAHHILQYHEIYEAHYLDILKVINQQADKIESLMIFGHNPGLSDLTNYICNSSIDLKTSHVAIIELEDTIDFESLSGGTGKLAKVITD